MLAFTMLHETTRAQSIPPGVWDPATPPTEVDIIILYTPRALAAQGDEEALRRSIQAAIDSANYSYAKSLIGVRLNPVLIALHSTWVENGDMAKDLGAMYSDARISTLRSDYKADFVYLVIESDASFAGGGAALLGNPQGEPNQCMRIMRRTVFVGNPRWAEYAGLTLMQPREPGRGARGSDRNRAAARCACSATGISS